MSPEQLLKLFRDELAPLFEEHELPTLGLRSAAETLESVLRLPSRVHVGFVGESQVGKSSLINALLGRRALPAGGVGPLTMRATEVQYSESPRFEVRYHGRTALNQLRFSIETYLARRGELRSSEVTDADGVDTAAVEATLEVDLVSEQESAAVDAGEKASTETTTRLSDLGEQFLTQARSLFTSDDGTEPKLSRVELVDGLRLILGQRPIGDAKALEPLAARIEEVRGKLGATEVIERAAFEQLRDFNRELRKRATGWLSQIVEELQVELDQPLLKHVTLVDLPGIGVLGDSAGQEAERFVKARGDALVLVVRNTGATLELASLLERTGVITRLLFGDREDVPPIHVKIAVTHLDNVAYEEFRRRAQIAEEDGDPMPDRDAIFAELSEKMAAHVRGQIRNHLLSSDALTDLEGEARDARVTVVERLCQRLEVVCVAAPDYLDLLSNQPSRFIQTKDGTGVPAVERALAKLGEDLIDRRHAHVTRALDDLRQGLSEHLGAVVAMYEEGGGKATVEWERFRSDLEAARSELAAQMNAYHARTLTILQQTLPQKLEVVGLRAEKIAHKRLDRMRSRAEDLHVQSLNAALLRRGRWEKKSVDYPGDLTRAFVDSIASEWEPVIIEEIRKTVRESAEQDIRLVEKLCEVAEKHDLRIVTDAHIEAQKKVLQQQSRSCIRWTQERLDALRGEVETALFDIVLEPVAAACKKAISKRANSGAGAKKRIIQAFHEGGSDALEKARERAVDLLRKQYDVVLSDLTTGYLSQHHDPIAAAFNAMTNDELARARRSDAQRRRHVLQKVEHARVQLGAA